MPLGIASLQAETSIDMGLLMAGAALASVPIIIVFEELVVDPLQGHVQVGVNAPVGQRVGILGIDHNSNSSQG